MRDNNISHIEIRKANHHDIPQICDLLAGLFLIEADFSADQNKQARGVHLLLEDKDRSLVLVASIRNEVIGMCTVQTLISTSEGGPVGLVEDVVVRNDYRCKGVGTELLIKIFTWCKEKGMTRVQLLADRDNHEALDFYASRGWTFTNLICMRIFTSIKGAH